MPRTPGAEAIGEFTKTPNTGAEAIEDFTKTPNTRCRGD